MRTRELGKSGLRATEIGLGCEHLQDKPAAVVESVVHAALDAGINIFDIFMSEPEVRSHIGTALKGRRDKVMLQGHIGAGWRDGQYFRTREPEDYRLFFDDFRTRLQTDYVDIGMLHFIDTMEDVDLTLRQGMLDYAVDLKQRGIIGAVGMSSHDPIAARRMVETGQIDVLMFSINPAYDLLPPETDIDGLFKPESYAAQETYAISPDRLALYQLCEANGVGITVMKALGAGALLDAQKSPYGAAMTVAQCAHYALSRPAVSSVLIGCATAEEVQAAVAYEQADDAARDYSAVLSNSPKFSMQGHCMYCNHCLPCPAHIDIAQVNKYLDLAKLSPTVPETVRAHYGALAQKADACIQCGECEARCPFGVPVIARMEEAAELL